MPLSHQELQQIIGEALPGFTIVNTPIADDPRLFRRPTQILTAKRNATGARRPEKSGSRRFAQDLAPDEITTVSVRSPQESDPAVCRVATEICTGSTKTRKIVAIQG